MKEMSARTNHEFPYGRTTILYHLLKKLDFLYRKTDKRKVIEDAWNSCLEVEIFTKNCKIPSRKICNCLLR